MIFLVTSFVILALWRIPDLRTTSTDSLTPSIISKKRPPIKFILFLGIEGTGHHFWQDLVVKESPISTQVTTYGLHPEYTKQLTGILYSHKKNRWKGLWSSPCKWVDSDPKPNTTAIFTELVSTLQAMKEQVHTVNAGRDTSTEETIIFPVNFLPTGGDFGVASYPGFLKPCRPLQYPTLDIWYDACFFAQVECEHVYLYRDPYAVIRSTTDNRNINKDKLEAIHLYTTMLHILYAQLSTFPNRLAGCWEFDDTLLSSQDQYEEINDVLGFHNNSVLRQAIEKIYRPRPRLTDSDKRNIVPLEFAVYMTSMSKIHERVVNLCKQQRTAVKERFF